MFNQVQTGKFIAEMRKEKKLTQKQLAESLGVSDKTVSKWETGRSLPDNAIMMDLCMLLGISVNELLSGEKFTEENYVGKAEETMLELIKENETHKKNNQYSVFSVVACFVLVVFICIFTFFMTGGVMRVSNFIDMPSIIIIFAITMAVLLASGEVRNFFRGFCIVYGKKVYTLEEIGNAKRAMKVVLLTVPLAGFFSMVVGLIAFMAQLSELSSVGPNLAVALLSMFYGVVTDILLLPTAARLWKK